MHQKKSELQIGKESSGVSSDFNPTPPLVFPSTVHQKHPQNIHTTSDFDNYYYNSSSSPITNPSNIYQNNPQQPSIQDDTVALSPTPKTTPHKRPLLSQNSSPLPKNLPPKTSSFLNSMNKLRFASLKSHRRLRNSGNKGAGFQVLRQLRRLRVHIGLTLLLCLPFFYFLVSHPSHSFVLDFLSAFAFSAVLLLSLNVALPRLPSIRLFLARSFPIKLGSKSTLPVFWSRFRLEKQVNSGCWVQAYSNGDVYQGEFQKGKCSGSGVYYYYICGRYEGDWVDGKYDGYGVETWARGSRYRGQYKQGLRNGFGVYRFYTGDVYAGEWVNGQSHGCVVHTCEDGGRYVGEFKWGVKHGLGHYHFRNGDAFAGEYFADKMHCFGVYCFANGHRYEGAWHEGKRQGLGMYTFRNGETQSGHWENGILNVPSTQNTTYLVSPVAVYHSKVLNAIQEARRAAERAYDVAKVDERVNRSVSAANMAANVARVAAVKAVQNQMHHCSASNEIPIPVVEDSHISRQL